MDEERKSDRQFYLTYTLVEGTALILAVLAYVFWHRDVALLVGSVVAIALVGSTYLLPRVLARRTRR